MNKVFLFINTAAHVPTMLAVAKLLERSGRYNPVIFFSHADLFKVATEKFELHKYDLYVCKNNEFVNLKITSDIAGYVSSKNTAVKDVEHQRRRWMLNFLGFLSSSLTYCFSIADYILMCLRLGRYRHIKYIFNRGACLGKGQDDVLQGILMSIFHQKMMRGYGDFSGRHPLECRNGMFYGLSGLRKYSYKISSLMESLRPVLIVLPEENIFYSHYLVIKEACSRGIRSCVIPFTVANQKEWFGAFYDDPEFQDDFRWNGLFIAAFPAWSACYKGRRLVLPGLHIFLSEYLECAPKEPWLINSGTADVIAVESEFMMDFYKRSGIESSRMRLTGSISDDRLYEALKNRDQQQLSMKHSLSISEADGNIFLMALPPDQFSSSVVNRTEFQGHQELIDYMLSVVMAEKQASDIVIVNLHPRTSIEGISLPSCEGLYVIHAAIEDLMPLSDLFIAVSSATIRQAVSCNMRVINYNAYGYDYDEYRRVESVVEVHTKAEYKLAVRKYVGGFSQLGSMSTRYGNPLDGGSDKRLLELFDTLAA